MVDSKGIYQAKPAEILFFDLEFYVPPQNRSDGYVMEFNPCRNDDLLLGGYFVRYWPLEKRFELPSQFWIWSEKNEKTMLANIYSYFKDSWIKLKNLGQETSPLIVCGFGVSPIDIPTLYIKGVKHHLDTFENLFNCYCKTKQLDLNNAAIPFLDALEAPYMYPKSMNLMFKRFGMQREKEDGKVVWSQYEEKKYDQIERRTAGEVKDCIEIYNHMLDNINEKARKKRR